LLFFYLINAGGQTSSGNSANTLIKGTDTIFICDTDIQVNLQANQAVYYRWTPINIFNDANIQNPIAKPTQSGWVYLTGLVNGNILKDSVYLSIIKPLLLKGVSNENPVCAGAPLILPISTNTGSQGITWISDEKISVLGNGSALIYPNKSGSVTVNQQIGSCRLSTSFFSSKSYQSSDPK
jgi:hypothetical protein